ncbi:hypothetical protein FBZ93_10542 [Bradyrhizobium macuxiense]|uniref:TonB C-terminal domain-containing protein n=1 Tax=Bradyrhizobium macuxiense TaxID=1755647 RepID=A0A560LYG6_9BRAD|nr:hypothetical protein [Bradyrhizobium macuxiense]TWC00250.1 hypothetical protein FBZ93_10542 [Bradyrhizobium macuxiense]
MLIGVATPRLPDHYMTIERSKAFALASFFLAAALGAVPISRSAAKDKMRGPDTWGPMFRYQVERCWKKPARVGGGAENVKVEITVDLTREGKLDGQPVVLPGSKPVTSDYAQAYQKSALRAIIECQPYTLPAEYYDQWKQFQPVFMEFPTPPTGKGESADELSNTRKLSICRGC